MEEVEDDIRKLLKFEDHEDMVKERKALFRKRRWRTIKKYTSEIEEVLRLSPDVIPWSEEKVRDWLNRLQDDGEATPNKSATLWNMIRPLSEIFKFIDPEGIRDLKAKMEATMDKLTANKL